MTKRYNINKSELEYLYLTNKMSISEIGEYYNCSQTTIYNKLKKYNIKTRTISESLKGRNIMWGHKISKSLKGRVFTEETIAKIKYAKRHDGYFGKREQIEADYGKPIKQVLEKLYEQNGQSIRGVESALSNYYVLYQQLYDWFKEEGIKTLTHREKTIKRQINEQFFEEWSSEMAWVFGLLMADGCITSNQHKTLQFGSTDLSLVKSVLHHLKSTHKSYTAKPDKNNIRKKNYYTICIARTKIYNDLVKLGMTERKSNTMNFPTIPDKYLNHFIRGYTDGDGSLTRFSVMYVSGSLLFLNKLHEKLENRNFNIKEVKQRPDHEGYLSHKPCYSLSVSGKDYIQWIYKGSSSSTRLDRKYNIVKEVL